MNRKDKLFAAVLITCLSLAACSSITQKDAETRAIQFINSNVKFFAKENNETSDIARYSIGSVSSYQQNAHWIVIANVKGVLGNDTRQRDLVIEVDSSGNIVSLNGQGMSN